MNHLNELVTRVDNLTVRVASWGTFEDSHVTIIIIIIEEVFNWCRLN